MRGKLCSAVVCLSALLLAELALGDEGPAEFTFLFWTDQEINHNERDGNFTRLVPMIDAMNTIAGKAYPPAIGGTVRAPDFITSGGDTTGWPTHYCVNTVREDVVRKRLKYPTRAVAGNHDSGGNSPSETFYRWLRKDPFIAARANMFMQSLTHEFQLDSVAVPYWGNHEAVEAAKRKYGPVLVADIHRDEGDVILSYRGSDTSAKDILEEFSIRTRADVYRGEHLL